MAAKIDISAMVQAAIAEAIGAEVAKALGTAKGRKAPKSYPEKGTEQYAKYFERQSAKALELCSKNGVPYSVVRTHKGSLLIFKDTTLAKSRRDLNNPGEVVWSAVTEGWREYQATPSA